MTTVSSTSSFCSRRRRRRLLGRQAAARRPRHHIRRRLRRAARCVGAFAAAPPAKQKACARTQRHRLVAARARAGPTWESERSSTAARARQGARRKGRAQVDGKWREGWESAAPAPAHAPAPSSDAPGVGVTGGLLSILGGFVIRIRILCILHVSCMYFACILM